jgi:hypothetical protein
VVDELGLDELATGGEDEGYVPCDELAAAETDLGADALAVAGEDGGFVPDGTGAAADPADESDSLAIYGTSSGFVPKPCFDTGLTCIDYDSFNGRTVVYTPLSNDNWGQPSGGASDYTTDIIGVPGGIEKYYVSGGIGFIQNDWAGDPPDLNMYPGPNGPFGGTSSFIERHRIAINQDFANSAGLTALWRFEWSLWSTQGGGFTPRAGGTIFSNNVANVNNIVDNAYYIVEVQYKANTLTENGYFKSRYWLDGATPGPFIIDNFAPAGGFGAGYSQDFIEMKFSVASAAVPPGHGPLYSFDWIRFCS